MEKDAQGEGRQFLDQISRSHPDCPGCGLPTARDENGNFFCPSCEKEYSMDGSDNRDHLKTVSRSRDGSRRTAIISILVIVLIMISTIAFGFLLYDQAGKEEGVTAVDVVEIRKLELSHEVKVEKMDRPIYTDHVRNGMDDIERERIRNMELMFRSLLVLENGWDLVALAENETADGSISFYDRSEDTIYILDDSMQLEYENMILAHDLCEALIDQNFDLEEYMLNLSYDAHLARSCVIEGDTYVTMDRWASKEMDLYDRLKVDESVLLQMLKGQRFYELYRSNSILNRLSLFPYQSGEDLIENTLKSGGWGSVNEMYLSRPPLSSEHVIHFEKYLEYERPEEISLNINGSEDQLVFSSVVGEKVIREMLPGLKGHISLLDENRTDLGWSGDVFHYFEKNGSHLSIFAVKWDTIYHNQLFFDGLDSSLAYRSTNLGDHRYRIRDEQYQLISQDNMTYMIGSNDTTWLDDIINDLGHKV
jgi:hypothetical protein